mgnify:FL=1|tara:strand:- start:941 stop:1540 length:600 start_codon:yes stop_codon:yes gene_type:complete
MIYIKDNFLPEIILNKLEEYLIDFREVEAGDKKFWIMETPIDFQEWIIKKLELLENKEIKCILSFFRIATDKLDTDWRIHCDSIINQDLPERAIVLHFSQPPNRLTGTAFWNHHKHGDSLSYDQLTDKEFDRLLLKDANDLNKWSLNTVVGQKKNRLLSYPSNYFHSKYPNKATEKGRKVFVMFYKYKNERTDIIRNEE